ncbi:Retrovirus-related Pol polyprotein from transposon RE2 [Senna tora]|uniref:Retrovirus-related Pol polyprotein from transposon RE2 n=1 Tax=Senna tora TaxID=362788 RepID=A0A834SP31_9FABA|nr:Retrovirus-related Pol polyprotein from transposon RE2 [Senna tora]
MTIEECKFTLMLIGQDVLLIEDLLQDIESSDMEKQETVHGFKKKCPMEVKCDNLAAISIAKHPVHHDRTKHVEIDRHFIKENLDSGNINLSHTPSHLEVADILTKSLCAIRAWRREKGIGLAGWDTCVSLSSKYGQPLAEDLTPILLVS